jgi:peroxiredoxin Q/BCP
MSGTNSKNRILSDDNVAEPGKARKSSPLKRTLIWIMLGLVAFFLILVLAGFWEMGQLPQSVRTPLNRMLRPVHHALWILRGRPRSGPICGTSVSGLAKALIVYANDYEQARFPPPDKWYDLLIDRDYVSSKQFRCPQAKDKGPGHYAINPNANPASDPDTVLIFETDAGWNQSGGPEILSTKNHKGEGCIIAFVDTHVRFVKKEQFGKLKWKSDFSKGKIMAQLKVGDRAPAFSLLDQDGNNVSLSDFKGQKILIYFYPKADTPGCTKQSCSVRDSAKDLAKLGVVPLGISPDEPEKQKKFDDKFNLGFTLLCDTDHKTAKAYGAWGEKTNYGRTYEGIIRSSFLIDEEGHISRIWYKVKPLDTVPEAIKALSD